MTETVFAYTSYRSFLRDRFEERKRAHPGMSLRSWARILGLSSHTMLNMILKGDRNPGESLTASFCRYLNLGPGEESYFRDLIELERVSENARARFQILERLARQRPTDDSRKLSRETFHSIARWHCYAVREMVSLPQFREDDEWIASQLQFRVTVGEIRDAIRTLLKVGLLTRDAEGRLRQAQGHLETTSDVADDAIRRFHEQALENARESLRRHPPPIREFHATTLATPMSRLPQAKELIRKFHREFRELMEDGNGDAVYHLEIGFFPLAMESGT